MAFSSPGAAVRHRFERRSRRLELARDIRDSLISLAGLVGRPVRHRDGEVVGRVADIVVGSGDNQDYPEMTGIIARIAARRAFIPAESIISIGPREVVLSTTRLDLRDYTAREDQTTLVDQVLDHQLVDLDGARVVRASDLYLAAVGPNVRLVGVDVGFETLLRRLGPARWRTRPTPDAVIDWASVHAFGPHSGRSGARLAHHRGELNTLRSAELADLLEDLGRHERHQLLDLVDPATAADALEEMDTDQLRQLLTEVDVDEAAGLIAWMEPDEAAEALRSLDQPDREQILAALPEHTRQRLHPVLAFPPRSAAGEMTTVMVLTHPDDTVADVRRQLTAQAEHVVDLDAIIVVDTDGTLIDDISLGELFIAEPHTPLRELVGPPWPITVSASADVDEVAQRLIDSRRLSVLVLDDHDRPLGRILADDVLDAVIGTRPRWQFPRPR